MTAKLNQASGGGDNGDDGINDDGLALITTMLETAKRFQNNNPHSYFAWAVPTLHFSTGGAYKNTFDTYQAHLWLLKQQDEEASAKNGWSRAELEEIESLYLSEEETPVGRFNYLADTLGINPNVETPDFRRAFDAFLKYKGYSDFSAWRNSVQIYVPVRRLPVGHGGNVVVPKFR